MYYKDMYICNMHQALSLTKHVQLCSMWTLTSSLHWVSKGHKHSKFNLLLITRHFEETTTGDLLLVNLVGYTQISGVSDVQYSMIIYVCYKICPRMYVHTYIRAFPSTTYATVVHIVFDKHQLKACRFENKVTTKGTLKTHPLHYSTPSHTAHSSQ